MLILSRKQGERIVIGPDIELTVVAIRGERVQLGFHAPKEVAIHREEILGQSCPGRQSGDTNGRATKSP